MHEDLILGFAMKHAWLIPGIPFFSFLLVGLFIRPLSNKAASIVATAAIFLAAACAYLLAWEYFHLFPVGTERLTLVPWSFEWLSFQKNLAVAKVRTAFVLD